VQADYALVVAFDDSAKPWSMADLTASFPRNAVGDVETDERSEEVETRKSVTPTKGVK
jgi:hypothetical protein